MQKNQEHFQQFICNNKNEKNLHTITKNQDIQPNIKEQLSIISNLNHKKDNIPTITKNIIKQFQ